MNARIKLIMKISKFCLLMMSIFALFFFLPHPALSQLVLGQYEDEAPLQTWNTFGITTASSLGRGGTSFTLSEGSAVSFSNPALLVKLPKFTLTFSGSYRTTLLNKYGIVNTGTFSSSQNSAFGLYSGDYAGISLTRGSWAFSLSVGVQENYTRPDISWDFEFAGQLYYSIEYSQTGILLNYNFSLAKKLTNGIALGLGLNLIQGTYEKHLEEQWIQADQTISDDKTFDFYGFFINGGIVFDISEKFTVAAVIRSPYRKNAASESLYRFVDSDVGTDIQIDGSETSIFHQPLMIGLGLQSDILQNLTIAADVSFLNWSDYEVTYFGEILRRDFKDVFRLNAGLEYKNEYPLFNTFLDLPIRLGVIYDPQPMINPSSYYFGYTLGAGIHFRNVHVDIGYVSGKEFGSGLDLAYHRILLTFNYLIGQII
ncbi:MAG: hypothetical protein MUP98_08335 [Candidatus Aminicenantes bacterium]|nr:hypothetical protein [Candidatus Aminicenantes bacterium]